MKFETIKGWRGCCSCRIRGHHSHGECTAHLGSEEAWNLGSSASLRDLSWENTEGPRNNMYTVYHNSEFPRLELCLQTSLW